MDEADKRGFFAEFIHGAVVRENAYGRLRRVLILRRTSP
jgi:hypothetical protein